MNDNREILAEIASEIEALHDAQGDTDKRLAEIETKLDRLIGLQRRALIERGIREKG